MEPLISVIIPVYNPGKHLIKCLDSIIGQTHRNLQIILIDDGSSDGSGDVCDEYAAKDSRVICYHQKNSGVSAARNKGLELASGDYYHFPDSDDYIELDSYEYLLDLAIEHGCDMVSFEYFVTYLDHENRHLQSDDYYGMVGTKDAHRLIITGVPFACNKLYAKKLIVGENGQPALRFREDIYRGEDSLFAHQAVDRAEKVWFDKRPLYHYVQSEESAVRGKFRTNQLSALKLFDAYKPIYDEKYPELNAYFLPQMLHLMITLYYDMWADEREFTDERKEVYEAFKQHEKTVYRISRLSSKQKLKFRFFSMSPTLFCRVHKSAHHL